jgi:Kef-type K+ transport system membrane component KefB
MAASLSEFIDWHNLPILLIIGFALFAGGVGAKLFQRLRIPQVVGYIVIGLLLGRSGLGLINEVAIGRMRLFNFFALGVIGFMIGGELKLSVFRRYGRQLLAILLSEGITAFLFVCLLITSVTFAFTHEWTTSLSLGLILGAIASATAPAATVDVLWEYKTRGPLTTSVFAIVALDDGLALILYGIAASIARQLMGFGNEGLLTSLGYTAYELIGAVILGGMAAVGLNTILRVARDHDKALTFILGTLVIVIGLTLALKVDMILSAMALGMCLANLAPRRSSESFKIIERFAPPIYVLFFVIVGARLNIGQMQNWMWVLVAVFVLGRTGGKMLGAYLGARWGNAVTAVQKYLGLCLFSQAGVAIGLAIIASESFTGEYSVIGNAVITIVTATTFIVQIIGPPCVKIAVSKAGEVGLNVTREDLMGSYTVADVMDTEVTCFSESDTFAKIMRTIRETDAMTYPVVDNQRQLLGIITIADLKRGLGSQGLADLLVAYDLMNPVIDTIEQTMPLSEAMTRMREQDLEYLPVVVRDKDAAADSPPQLAGLLEYHKTERMLSREVLRRQEAAIDHEQTNLLRAAIRKRRQKQGK